MMTKGQFKERIVAILTNGGMDRLTDLTFELVKSADVAHSMLLGAIDVINDEVDLDEEAGESAEASDAARDLKGALRAFVGFDMDRS